MSRTKGKPAAGAGSDEMKFITMKVVGGEPPSNAVLSATVAEQDGLEANSMGSRDWVYSLLTSCESLARYAPPLCLSFFICNMGLITVSTLL